MSIKSVLLKYTGRSFLTKTFVCIHELSPLYPVTNVYVAQSRTTRPVQHPPSWKYQAYDKLICDCRDFGLTNYIRTKSMGSIFDNPSSLNSLLLTSLTAYLAPHVSLARALKNSISKIS